MPTFLSKPVYTLGAALLVLIAVGGLMLPAVLASPDPSGEMAQFQPEATEDPTMLDTQFTYQGYLEQDGVPVTASCDLQFGLFNALAAGTQIGTTITHAAVAVTDGRFNVALDFGVGVFNGADRWLEVAARCPTGTGNYTTLTPRQPITAVPYAMSLYGLRAQSNLVSPNIIGGSQSNTVTDGVFGATISGGGAVYQPNGTNWINRVTDYLGTIGGGADNQAGNASGALDDAEFATVSGGRMNIASGENATVSGGEGNIASGQGATVGGGRSNIASGTQSTIVGGFGNRAEGIWSVVPGGLYNHANGNFSFAGGFAARVNPTHYGSFVWAGLWSDTQSFAPGSFTVRAQGGARFYTTESGVTTGVELPAGGGAWASLSDRASKENFAPVDARAVLDAVASLPITTWNYISQEDTVRHMGVVAQDFYAAFGLGESDTRITTVDMDGVALASIQGLNAKLEAENADLRAENADQQAQIDDLRARLAALEGLASSGEQAGGLPFAVLAGVGLLGAALLRRR